MDDDAENASDHESDGSDAETDGTRNSRSGEYSEGHKPLGEPRPWVHPSEFRRFVDLHASNPPLLLSPAEQARRSAIAMVAMGFLVAGLLLLTGGSHPSNVQTVQLTFTPHPSLLLHFASSGTAADSKGAQVTSYFANEANDSKFKIGDIIIGCDHAPIENVAALTTCLRRHDIDELVEFELVRQEQIRHVKVQLESDP